MSNYSIAKRLLPNTMNDWLLYNEATPFNLSGINNAGSLSQVDNSVGGAVKVERAMARFDFRDGSRSLPENCIIPCRILIFSFTDKFYQFICRTR